MDDAAGAAVSRADGDPNSSGQYSPTPNSHGHNLGNALNDGDASDNDLNDDDLDDELNDEAAAIPEDPPLAANDANFDDNDGARALEERDDESDSALQADVDAFIGEQYTFLEASFDPRTVSSTRDKFENVRTLADILNTWNAGYKQIDEEVTNRQTSHGDLEYSERSEALLQKLEDWVGVGGHVVLIETRRHCRMPPGRHTTPDDVFTCMRAAYVFLRHKGEALDSADWDEALVTMATRAQYVLALRERWPDTCRPPVYEALWELQTKAEELLETLRRLSYGWDHMQITMGIGNFPCASGVSDLLEDMRAAPDAEGNQLFVKDVFLKAIKRAMTQTKCKWHFKQNRLMINQKLWTFVKWRRVHDGQGGFDLEPAEDDISLATPSCLQTLVFTPLVKGVSSTDSTNAAKLQNEDCQVTFRMFAKNVAQSLVLPYDEFNKPLCISGARPRMQNTFHVSTKLRWFLRNLISTDGAHKSTVFNRSIKAPDMILNAAMDDIMAGQSWLPQFRRPDAYELRSFANGVLFMYATREWVTTEGKTYGITTQDDLPRFYNWDRVGEIEQLVSANMAMSKETKPQPLVCPWDTFWMTALDSCQTPTEVMQVLLKNELFAHDLRTFRSFFTLHNYTEEMVRWLVESTFTLMNLPRHVQCRAATFLKGVSGAGKTSFFDVFLSMIGVVQQFAYPGDKSWHFSEFSNGDTESHQAYYCCDVGRNVERDKQVPATAIISLIDRDSQGVPVYKRNKGLEVLSSKCNLFFASNGWPDFLCSGASVNAVARRMNIFQFHESWTNTLAGNSKIKTTPQDGEIMRQKAVYLNLIGLKLFTLRRRQWETLDLHKLEPRFMSITRKMVLDDANPLRNLLNDDYFQNMQEVLEYSQNKALRSKMVNETEGRMFVGFIVTLDQQDVVSQALIYELVIAKLKADRSVLSTIDKGTLTSVLCSMNVQTGVAKKDPFGNTLPPSTQGFVGVRLLDSAEAVDDFKKSKIDKVKQQWTMFLRRLLKEFNAANNSDSSVIEDTVYSKPPAIEIVHVNNETASSAVSLPDVMTAFKFFCESDLHECSLEILSDSYDHNLSPAQQLMMQLEELHGEMFGFDAKSVLPDSSTTDSDELSINFLRHTPLAEYAARTAAAEFLSSNAVAEQHTTANGVNIHTLQTATEVYDTAKGSITSDYIKWCPWADSHPQCTIQDVTSILDEYVDLGLLRQHDGLSKQQVTDDSNPDNVKSFFIYTAGQYEVVTRSFSQPASAISSPAASPTSSQDELDAAPAPARATSKRTTPPANEGTRKSKRVRRTREHTFARK